MLVLQGVGEYDYIPLVQWGHLAMRQGLFLFFLVLGIACLVGALFVTRLTWRPDIEPFGRQSRLFQIALHPERFATSDRLIAIRALNLVGAVFVLLAVGVVAFDVVASMEGP
jgi:hypothetical protein